MRNLKEQAAIEAIQFIEDDTIVGVGTGSTVNYFIEQLAEIKHRLDACVPSSLETEKRLRAAGIPVVELNGVNDLPYYFDGADEVNEQKQMIKGGGGALTREKIIANVAKTFICMVDESKCVQRLGAFPLAVEVIPMARSFVARQIVTLGGDPEYREGFVTDNGNIILDVYNLSINNPEELEQNLKLIPGVVENGLFSKRIADKVIIACEGNVKIS